ncbi:unnamed protein product [Macrosiphum euphorbiae]|uniref:Endonuclease/exonuclease/phosphatase domain-containing protein n=1 Tax=Macrosiphum euphorbiae TaxID=13131 RepID=A0AAV0WCB8_9HEMI|nr:unnamed protein product [Macrosiphum euphorbiae]
MTTSPNVNYPLSIFSWNANGLRQHINELQHILSETNADIALIFETHFTQTPARKSTASMPTSHVTLMARLTQVPQFTSNQT